MPLILLHTHPKVRAQREHSAANQWVHAIENIENTILFSLFYGLLGCFFFFSDPKDNISYKHLVPWIGMYSQGFACQE